MLDCKLNKNGIVSFFKESSISTDECIMMRLDELIAEYLHEGRPPEVYAKHMAVKESRLEKCLKAHHGMSLRKYLVKKRNEQAYRLLQESVLQIKEIAFVAGFASISSFSKTFKLLEGIGPQAYRKALGVNLQQRYEAQLLLQLETLFATNMEKWSKTWFYANELNVCRKVLDNCVRKAHGIGLGKYLQQLRKQEACRLLKETELPIKAISKKIGFLHPSTLCKTFKISENVTPKKLRTSLKSKEPNKLCI